MNLTNIVNAMSREFRKEIKKELDRTGKDSVDVKTAENCFDRAAMIVVSREFDKFRKMGPPKP